MQMTIELKKDSVTLENLKGARDFEKAIKREWSKAQLKDIIEDWTNSAIKNYLGSQFKGFGGVSKIFDVEFYVFGAYTAAAYITARDLSRFYTVCICFDENFERDENATVKTFSENN